MAWFRKKPDPLSDRARVLSDEIARLETQIQQLDSKLQQDHSQPRLRSTALPNRARLNQPHGESPVPAAPGSEAPIFEELGADLLNGRSDTATTPEHYNDLGMRKYDLPALLRRLRGQFRGPSTTNPKLVSYLAAGGIQGLRPLRYEKRVARNRFIASVAILFFLLLGTLWVIIKHR